MVARSAAFAEGLFFAPYIIWGIDTARRPEKLPKTSAMVKSVYVKMQKSNEINHHAVLFMRNAEPEIVVFPKSTAAKLLKKAHQRQRQAGATYGFPSSMHTAGLLPTVSSYAGREAPRHQHRGLQSYPSQKHNKRT